MCKNLIIISSLMLAFLFGCKSTKSIGEGNANLKLSSKQLIKENIKKAANFKTLQAKLKITFSQKGKSQTYSVSFRTKKDEAIWINATFSVIRAMVTPEKVSFYNKLDKTYFDGDYKYLSDLLGTELDYKKVQNLLLGETLYQLIDKDYKASVNDGVYVLQPKKQRELFEIFFLIDPSIFKVKSQQISQPKAFRHLQIDYTSYQDIDQQVLPKQINIIAVEENDETNIGLEFKNVTLNQDLNFPFKIPSGYDKIKL